MGWRFRRTFSFKPFRFVVTKRGVGVGAGWNWGIPGLRFGLNPSGDPYISLGIHGTGLYWIKYFKRRPSTLAPPSNQQNPSLPVPPTSSPTTQPPQKWWIP